MNFLLIELENTGYFSDDIHTTFEDNRFIEYSNGIVIITSLLEYYHMRNPINAEPYGYLEHTINQLSRYYSRHSNKIIVILNTHYEKFFDFSKIQNVDELIFIDSFLYNAYSRSKIRNISKTAEYIKHKENKFLFIPGKAEKLHRSGLLYRLYTNNLLEKANYSYYVNNDYLLNSVSTLLKENYNVPLDQGLNFIKQTVKKLDNIPISLSDQSTHYTGWPFETTIYEESSFQIISETEAFIYDSTIGGFTFSEKTWNTIVNKRPFIFVGALGALDLLEDLGFETFRKYLPYKDYNSDITSISADFTLIIENVKYWIQNIHYCYDELKIDVDKNYNLLVDYAVQYHSKLKNIVEKYNLNCEPWELAPGVIMVKNNSLTT